MGTWKLIPLVTLLLWSSLPRDVAAAEPVVEIDRIELIGVTAIEGPDVEAALEIIAGESLERTKVVRSLENLQSLYRLRGFEQVRVRSDLVRERGDAGTLENVVRIQVEEGKPTRIGRIRLESARQGDADSSSRLEALHSGLGLRLGDRLDQEKVAVDRRAIQDLLATQEFIGARAAESASPMDAPAPSALPTGVRPGDADRWVELVFKVDLGDRVAFGFRGNTVFTSGRLSSLVDELRLVGFSRDYISSIQDRIEDEYRASGYARVRVTPYTFEGGASREKKVTFEISEGPKVRLGRIDFDGNAVFGTLALREEFLRRAPVLTQHGYYSEKEIGKSVELLVEWLRSQGYLASKVVTVRKTFNPKGDQVELVVYLYEGRQTRVEAVEISGLTVFARDEILAKLGVQEGRAINLFSFNEGIEALKAAYRARGYLDFRVRNEGTDRVVAYADENRLAHVKLEFEEGPLARVSRIEVEGLSGTREDIVRRALRFQKDEPLLENRISESEALLRKLGIFSFASIRVEDDSSRPAGYKVVRVSVQEGTPGLIAGGLGFRNDLGIRLFGQTAYSNLWHANHTLSLTTNVNRRFDEDFCSKGRSQSSGNPLDSASCFLEYQVELGYLWPWFLAPELTFRPRVTVERTIYQLLDTESVAIALTFDRPLFHTPSLIGGLSYSLERVRQFNASSAQDNDNIRIGSITPSLRLDMRDNPLAPTRGLFASASYEIASPLLFSQSLPFPVGFTRFQFRSDYYLRTFFDLVAYLSFRTGLEHNTETPDAGDPLASKYQIPLSKQFALGGSGSLRGFKQQELNIQDVAVRGYASYVNYRFELSLPFSGNLRFVPFLDAANLLVDRYSLGMLRFGTGAGLHYLSPIGPVNFDWGFKVQPRANEDPYRFYFSIGVI